MKLAPIRAAVFLALVASVTTPPDTLLAQGSRDGQRDGSKDGHGDAKPVVPRPGVPRPPVNRPFPPFPYPRPIVPGPYVSFGYPDAYGAPSAYEQPAGGYSPSVGMVSVSPPASPPPPPVIEHENGRYELRGDGVSSPYLWVWVPNPPPPPLAPPPIVAAAPPAPRRPDPAPSPHEIYRWTDDQGVVNWTDRWDSIPEQYRSRVKRLPI